VDLSRRRWAARNCVGRRSKVFEWIFAPLAERCHSRSDGASLALLGRAVRDIPVGTAYAAWTGIGAVGTAILGMTLFGESRELGRFLCIALIVLGVVGLKFIGE
jgi:hypothetical protein